MPERVDIGWSFGRIIRHSVNLTQRAGTVNFHARFYIHIILLHDFNVLL
jgi:hypothetical protein